MIAVPLNDLFVTIVGSLPMIFLLGAPLVLLLVSLAALLDTKLPTITSIS